VASTTMRSGVSRLNASSNVRLQKATVAPSGRTDARTDCVDARSNPTFSTLARKGIVDERRTRPSPATGVLLRPHVAVLCEGAFIILLARGTPGFSHGEAERRHATA
jgi:hypothetical protein